MFRNFVICRKYDSGMNDRIVKNGLKVSFILPEKQAGRFIDLREKSRRTDASLMREFVEIAMPQLEKRYKTG